MTEIRAKPLKWTEANPSTTVLAWEDDVWDFFIIRINDSLYSASSFTAKPNLFSTFEEAENWCQQQADDFIRERAMFPAGEGGQG